MLFTEVPFMERFALAHKAGFKHIEYLFPYAYKVEDLKAELQQHGLQQVFFNLPSGVFGPQVNVGSGPCLDAKRSFVPVCPGPSNTPKRLECHD